MKSKICWFFLVGGCQGIGIPWCEARVHHKVNLHMWISIDFRMSLKIIRMKVNQGSESLRFLQSIIYVRRLEYFSMAAQATSLHWVDWKQLIWDSTPVIGEAESLKLTSKYLKLPGTETHVENSLKVK